jgi:CHAT domain-containing protein
LPWELLYDPEKEEFLSLSKRALITRFLHVPRPISPLQAQLPLRILVAIASPQDLERLDSEAEVKKIEKALAEPVAQNLIQYDILRDITTRDLRDALMNPYHVLHFIGHGAFEEGSGSLAFEDSGSDAAPVSGRTLGTLLKSSSVRLVVLNACESAQNATNTQAFTGVGPALVEAGIPAVVAMQFVVGDDSARAFAQDFYGMLSYLLPVDECVSRARGPDGRSWYRQCGLGHASAVSARAGRYNLHPRRRRSH